MQTQEAIELYNEVMDVVNEGDDATIKKDRNGKLHYSQESGHVF